MSDLALTDPVRALRGAIRRIRIATRRFPDSEHTSLYEAGLDEDLSIAERAIGILESGAVEVASD